MNQSSRDRLDMDHGSVKKSPATSRLARCGFERAKNGLLVPKWFAFLALAVLLIALASIPLAALLGPSCSDSSAGATNASLGPGGDGRGAVRPEPYASRLPSSLVPISYNVTLQPFIVEPLFYFDGNVTMILHCRETATNITMHFNDLIIFNETLRIIPLSNNSLENSLAVQIKPTHFYLDYEQQLYTIVLDRSLEAGKFYSVSMRFRGNLNDDLCGFYRSSYNTSGGEQRWLAVTQFQPTDARRAFPCFDEPALKATFNITLIHWANMTALSNMPLKAREDRGEWVEDRFETTVNMSTYLLAFVVGNLSSIEDVNASPKFRVWSRPEALNASRRALFMGPKMLQHYENFFNISFPLPKTDMVAVPDFNAGAMENWGLIIYRETALLFDPAMASAYNLQRVATVVAHELAHQWFGNLVTPKWWDDLWLNEGFASYMEYEGVDSVFPKWKMHEQFVVDEVQDVFELDCLASSHPISVKVNHPDEINEIFDRISYGKGGSIIRMMNFLLGPKDFQRGVSNYLKALRFSNAEQDDLWNYLTDVQTLSAPDKKPVNVKQVMDSWTLQDGYPVVTLTRDYKTGTAQLDQKRFVLSKNNSELSKNSSLYLWEIPITYITQRNAAREKWDPVTKLWMHTEQGHTIEMPKQELPAPDEWIIINVQQVGYYRVNYNVENWELLTRQLKSDHQAIHVTNRAQIVDDALDLSRAGLLDYAIALNVTQYLSKEADYIPWEAGTAGFSFLDMMLRRSALFGKYKEYVLSLIKPLYERMGWQDINDDDILRQFTQQTALSWACKYELDECINATRVLFGEWKRSVLQKHKNPVNPNLRSFVYCTAIEYGNAKDWDFTWKQYLANQDASEKDKLMRALACSREPWILRRYVSWAFDENSGIRRQDGSYVFRAVAGNNYGRDIAYGYLRERWDDIVKYYGKSFFSFGSLVKSATSSLTTQFEVQQLKDFYGRVKHNVGTAQRSFLQAIEQAEANVDWMENYYKGIEEWLSNWQPN